MFRDSSAPSTKATIGTANMATLASRGQVRLGSGTSALAALSTIQATVPMIVITSASRISVTNRATAIQSRLIDRLYTGVPAIVISPPGDNSPKLSGIGGQATAGTPIESCESGRR